MNPVVAVIAPGMMGAAVGKRLVDHGLKVLTSLKGRSAETSARAKTAGMVSASAPMLVLYILFQKHFIQGLMAGAVK